MFFLLVFGLHLLVKAFRIIQEFLEVYLLYLIGTVLGLCLRVDSYQMRPSSLEDLLETEHFSIKFSNLDGKYTG